MLKLEDVYVKYGAFNALDGVNCTIEKQDFILILGHNGAGKSTFFDVISGKVKATSGKIWCNSKDVSLWPERKRTAFVSRVFQNTHMGSVSELTVEENLALACLKGKVAGFPSLKKQFPERVVEEVIKPLNLGLEKFLKRPIGLLSGGQRQIITILMATLKEPELLLLDEPTAALDPKSSENLIQFLEGYTKKKNIATLMITHDVKEVCHLANKIWELKQGQLILGV